MDILFTPWRMKYIASTKKSDSCVFCAALNTDPGQDRENFLLYRGRHTFVVMNIYPYNTGHLLILPREHVAALPEVPPAAQFELMSLASYFTALLSQLMKPDGFNMGLNMGRAAGAGIDDHLHLHLVPRWGGDSNFMSIVGQTRVIPEELETTYDRIVALLSKNPPVLK